MNQNLKTALLAVVCFLVGAGGFYAWSTMDALKKENTQLNEQLAGDTTAPAATDTTTGATTGTTTAQTEQTAPAAEDDQELGSISGALGFPSQGIPPLVIHAFKAGSAQSVTSITTQQNQMTYTIEGLAPGTYNVVAYTASEPAMAGGYTKAVPCGLSVDCTDHTSFPIIITPGRKAVGIDLKDWYAPEGTFPAKPK